MIAFVWCAVIAGSVYGWYRFTPRDTIALPGAPLPRVTYPDGELALQSPTGVLVADVGEFHDQFLAYLCFDYLRSRSATASSQVLLTRAESGTGPRHRVRMVLADDLISAVPYLSDLQAKGYFEKFELRFLSPSILRHDQSHSAMFVAAYSRAEFEPLETARDEQLIAPVARFLLFKSRTDPRVRNPHVPGPARLSPEEAHQLATDIVAVARFYSLPLDLLLGVGAMENNYMHWAGDLKHVVWKRRPDPDDIVLKRQRGRVLVRNYSLGLWQITRETLRHTHQLYLKDTRDYTLLPPHLQPEAELDPGSIPLPVLTTYAGLLLRNLLDRSNGDVEVAAGAYNRSIRKPNLEYAAGVRTVGDYARRMLERELVLRKRSAPEYFVSAIPKPKPQAPVAAAIPLAPAD